MAGTGLAAPLLPGNAVATPVGDASLAPAVCALAKVIIGAGA